MKRRVISVVLAASMIAALCAGCGGTEKSAGTEGNTPSSAGEEQDASSEGKVNLGAEITIKMPNTGCITDGTADVVAAINAITEESIGVTVKDIEWIGLGDYPQQLNLMFSSQEACDLIMTTPLLPYASMKNQDELMDISEYLDEYGQDIKSISPTYLEAYTDGDAVYGIPVHREKAGSFWINMRTDILEELGLLEDAKAMDSWSDYYAILDKVKEAHPELTPCYFSATNNVGAFLDATVDTSAENWSDCTSLDNLGDAYNLVYVDENGKVASYYDSDAFTNGVNLVKDMAAKGYINSDATTIQEDGVTNCKNQKCFSWIGGGESSNQATSSLNSGYDITCVSICGETATSFLTTMWGFAVPYTSENPEAAVAFMNELYTNPDLANLFVWGVEGTDWQKTDDGFAQYASEDGTASYHSCTWLTGNALQLTPWENNPTVADQEAIMAEETPSEYLGFFANTADIEQTITACVNVVNEYRGALYVGANGDNTDAMLAEMRQKLEAAGINDVVAEYQTQLDAWLAEQ